MAKYRKQGDWRAERRGIIRGIQAMREHIALHFGQWTGRPFMGAEVVGVVNSLPGPRVADEPVSSGVHGRCLSAASDRGNGGRVKGDAEGRVEPEAVSSVRMA